MIRPGFIRIPRTNGPPCVVRADQLTALLPQEPKTKASAPEVTMQFGTIVVHTTLTVEQIAGLVQNATGMPMVIVEPVEPV